MYNSQCTVSVSFEEPEPIVHDSMENLREVLKHWYSSNGLFVICSFSYHVFQTGCPIAQFRLRPIT